MLTINDLANEQQLSSVEMGKVAGGASCEFTVTAAGAVLALNDDVATIGGQQGALYLACCNGKHIQSGKLTVRK